MNASWQLDQEVFLILTLSLNDSEAKILSFSLEAESSSESSYMMISSFPPCTCQNHKRQRNEVTHSQPLLRKDYVTYSCCVDAKDKDLWCHAMLMPCWGRTELCQNSNKEPLRKLSNWLSCTIRSLQSSAGGCFIARTQRRHLIFAVANEEQALKIFKKLFDERLNACDAAAWDSDFLQDSANSGDVRIADAIFPVLNFSVE